jgi:hypothetical protein
MILVELGAQRFCVRNGLDRRADAQSGAWRIEIAPAANAWTARRDSDEVAQVDESADPCTRQNHIAARRASIAEILSDMGGRIVLILESWRPNGAIVAL